MKKPFVLTIIFACLTLLSQAIVWAGVDTNSPQQYSNWYGTAAAVAEKSVVLNTNTWSCSVKSRTKNPVTVIQQIGWTYWTMTYH